MHGCKGQQGSLLVEALVGVAILAVALIPMLGSLSVTTAAQDQAARQSAGLNIARGRLEALHGLSGAEWDALADQAPAPDVDLSAYSLALTVTARPGVTGLKDFTVVVTWTGTQGRSDSLTMSTSVARRP